MNPHNPMKKLTTLTASLLVGFGLVSCKGNDTSKNEDADTKKADTAQTGASSEADSKMETVSLKITGMT